MKCDQATKLISEAHERTLSFSEKIGLKSHLITCSYCRKFEKNCQYMSKLMKKFAQETE